MRSFAKQVDLSPATVSRFLKGEITLAQKTANAVSVRANFSELERKVFLKLVEIDHLEDSADRETAFREIKDLLRTANRKTSSKATPPDFFCLEAVDILHRIRIQSLPNNARTLAIELEISEEKVNFIIDGMKRDFWISGTWGNFEILLDTELFQFAFPTLASKQFYKSLLELNLRSLEFGSVQNRAIGFETIVLDESQWPELRKLTHRFLDQVDALAKQSKNPTLIVRTLASSVITRRK